jgi:Copper type II ascorbate-dependent monooxygenase, C-terminal domain
MTARRGRGGLRAALTVGIGMTALLAVACTTGSSGTGGTTPSTKSTASAATGTHSGHGSTGTPTAAPLRAGERFVDVAMPAAYTPKAPNGGTDEYRCFLVDPGLAGDAFLTGSQFLPGNAELVHHAILFRVEPDRIAAARTLDDSTPGEGWTCFGDDGVDGNSAWVGHWAPGVSETLLAPDVGYPMAKGSGLVLQVHYNLLAAGGAAGGSDTSGVRLRVTDRTAGMKPLDTAQLPAPIELPCTAAESGPLCDRSAAVADVGKRFGAEIGGMEDELVAHCGTGTPTPGPTQHCDHRVPSAVTAYAVAGHMHLLGRAIKIELNPGTPGARTLLDVPAYNFDDQGVRPLATPVPLKAGDTLRVTCTHDAKLRSMLPQLRDQPARYVVWGDGTSDEMCLGLVVVTPTT